MPSTDEGLAPGTILNERYRIEKKIGAGGMSHVYLSIDQWKKTNYAVIKIPFVKFLHDKWVVRKFKQEAESLSRLKHPGIVQLLGHGIYEQQFPFVILEYINGINLTDILADIKPDPQRSLRIILQICEALEHAHREEIFHRDLKPDNIMVVNANTDNESVKIIDFGIARIDNSFFKTSSDTRHQAGTPHYFSPNRLRHDPDDRADDIYAIGLITYEIFTGINPLRAANNYSELKILHENITPPRNILPSIPLAVSQEIVKALSLHQGNRHTTIEEFGKNLQAAFGEESGSKNSDNQNNAVTEDKPQDQISTVKQHTPDLISKIDEAQKHLISASISAGEKFLIKGDFQAAIDFYNELISQETLSDNFYSRRAMAYLLAKDFEQSLKDCQTALKLNINNDFAHLIQGLNYRLKLWTQDAETSLLKAVHLNQNNIEAALILGDIYVTQGFNEKALKYYMHIEKVNPQFGWTNMSRGSLYYKAGDYDSAITDFTHAITLIPELSWNYLQRARSYIKSGRQQQAVYDLNQAIRLSPNNKTLYHARAKLYFNLGQTKEALEDFNQIKNMSDTDYSFSDDESDLLRIKKTGLFSLLDYLEWMIYKSRS